MNRFLLLVAFFALLATATASTEYQKPEQLYAWRGIQVDVARHYFDLATLEKLVDVAAHLHLNVLHIHFTDDNAWRLPTNRYPRVISAQYYTLRELQELVAYAKQRGVTIVPEIDLPAHSTAVVRAYPKLACGSSSELCASNATMFADSEISELLPMFPSPWIHLGGDEVTSWTKQERRAFETHVTATLRRAHRTAVVWDEEADVAPRDAIVMVWHLGNAARGAMESGHRVVMASDGPLYFNAAQGDPSQEPPASRYVTTLEEVYAFSPPTGALGLEATLWSEKIATPRALWYMLLPRALALAEIASTPPERKSWQRFYHSLPAQLAWLDQRGYTYRVPNVMFHVNDPEARFESVAGNVNAARVYVNKAVLITAESATASGTTYIRSNHGPWLRVAQMRNVLPGATIEAYSETHRRRGAVTTLYVRRLEHGTTAHSLTFDAVVSP
ncbi:MAG: family 20 glycosylhydrolase [Candidatus Eremiobacteraeota bacterium]|nr:family 20 glycosylhydrolase [Candidatus Eremiobacteraeota bacterium]